MLVSLAALPVAAQPWQQRDPAPGEALLAAEVDAADRKAIRAVIADQLEAFRRADAPPCAYRKLCPLCHQF